jgi:hypothetical protein
MEKLTLVKVGGKIVEDAASLQTLLKDFSKMPVTNLWFTAADAWRPI